MNFDPYDRLLKIWESIGTPTPKVRIHLGVWASFPLIFLNFWEYEMWLMGLIFEPKAKIMIITINIKNSNI
jgi:hypothetical protein